jgi:hypothetical protein
MGLSEAEWLKELERLAALSRDRKGEGWSREEWSQKLGASPELTRRALKVAAKEGRLRRDFRTGERLDGSPYKMPVYSITPPAKPSGPTRGRRGAGSSRD